MQNDRNVLASVAVVLKARVKAYLPLCFLQASPYFLYLCVFASVELKTRAKTSESLRLLQVSPYFLYLCVFTSVEGMGEDILVDVIPSGKSTFAPA